MHFPLNYMHLVCLGVMKRFLLFWKEGPRPFRLEPFQIYQISERLKKHDRINPLWVCSTDQRAGWTKQIKSYRIKNILLYVGPIVLKVILRPEKCILFLSLSVSIRILLKEGYNIWIAYSGYVKTLCYKLYGILWWDFYIL